MGTELLRELDGDTTKRCAVHEDGPCDDDVIGQRDFSSLTRCDRQRANGEFHPRVLEPDLVLARRQISDCPHAVGIDDDPIDWRLVDVPAAGCIGLPRDVAGAHFVDRAAGGLIERDTQRTGPLLARADRC